MSPRKPVQHGAKVVVGLVSGRSVTVQGTLAEVRARVAEARRAAEDPGLVATVAALSSRVRHLETALAVVGSTLLGEPRA